MHYFHSFAYRASEWGSLRHRRSALLSTTDHNIGDKVGGIRTRAEPFIHSIRQEPALRAAHHAACPLQLRSRRLQPTFGWVGQVYPSSRLSFVGSTATLSHSLLRLIREPPELAEHRAIHPHLHSLRMKHIRVHHPNRRSQLEWRLPSSDRGDRQAGLQP